MTDYKEKIKKLLALAESDNENEARAALLKAKELMAEHKIAQADVIKKEEEIVRSLTDITFSNRRDPWMLGLAQVIAENYCCKSYRNHWKGEKTYTIGFVGFKEDEQLCEEIFKYAVDCIHSMNQRIRKSLKRETMAYQTKMCNSFGYGFVFGIKDAFESQAQTEKNQEWGLVMVVPEAVTENLNSFAKPGHYNPKAQHELSGSGYQEGYSQGKNFNPDKKLATA